MAYINSGECTLYAESFGDAADPALLFISGLSGQLLTYSEDFCQAFVDRGFFVIRMDNRDVGLSTHFEGGPDYTLSDMATDCRAVLEHFDAVPAHVFGFSMGGMIAQTLAIEHPNVVASLISAGSTTGHPEYGRATDEAINALLLPEATTRHEAIENSLAGKKIWGTPDTWYEDQARQDFGAAWDRAVSPGAGRRQLAAIGATGNREEGLALLATPTLVIHGGIDPLITPSGGRRTAEVIPNARYEQIEGMAHDIPLTELPHIVALVTAHAASAERAQ